MAEHGSPEEEIVVTEEQHGLARILIETMQGGLERKRRVWQLRERVSRLNAELLAAKAELAVEEAEQADEAKLVRDMWEQLRADLETTRGKGGNP